MKPQNHHWILVADRAQARLLRGWRLAHDRTHIDEIGAIQSPPADREHHRPQPLGAKDGHSYASFHHEDEERLHRFVGEVVTWLEREVDAHDIRALDVFAPSRFLGAFGKRASRRFQTLVRGHDVELVNLGPGDLARHPTVARVVEEASGNRRSATRRQCGTMSTSTN